MPRWNIRTFTTDAGGKPVEEWIESLSPTGRAEVVAAIGLLEQHGVELGMPQARSLADGLWELRIHDRGGAQRVIYFHWKGRTFALLHGFTKRTQRTPRRELETARRRRDRWLERSEGS